MHNLDRIEINPNVMMGSKRAMGRPGSVMITSSPALTWRKHVRNDVLSCDTVVVCTASPFAFIFCQIVQSSNCKSNTPRAF